MNNARAKKMRRVVAGLDLSDTPKYDEVRFMRKRRVYAADGTYTEVDHYPVRILFLVKCKRAAYQRLKNRPRDMQDNLIAFLGELP